MLSSPAALCRPPPSVEEISTSPSPSFSATTENLWSVREMVLFLAALLFCSWLNSLLHIRPCFQLIVFYLFLFKDRILPRQLWRKPLRGWFEGWTRRRESLASWSPLRWWSTAWSWHCCFVSLFTLRTFLIVSPNRKISFDSQVTLPVFTTEH